MPYLKINCFSKCIIYYYYLFGIKIHTRYKHTQYKTKARDIGPMPRIKKSLPKNCSPKDFNSNIPGLVLKIYNYLQKTIKT